MGKIIAWFSCGITSAVEKASEEAMFKADSILRNKYPQFYEKGKD